MPLGLFAGFCWGGMSLVWSIWGQALGPIPNYYRDLWIMVGGILAAAVVLGFLGQLSLVFPRMLFGCCILLAPLTFVAAIISLFTGQARYSVPLFVLALASAAALWICGRITAPIKARLVHEQLVAEQAFMEAREVEMSRRTDMTMVCGACGSEVSEHAHKCPQCGSSVKVRRGLLAVGTPGREMTKRQESEYTADGERNFPTEGYSAPGKDSDADGERYWKLRAEAELLGTLRRSARATQADIRAAKGPTEADRRSIPYIQEAWEWAVGVAPRVGLRPGMLRYGVFIDEMTRMLAATLIADRDSIDIDDALSIVGFDPGWIQIEHNARPDDVDRYILAVQPFIERGSQKSVDLPSSHCTTTLWDTQGPEH